MVGGRIFDSIRLDSEGISIPIAAGIKVQLGPGKAIYPGHKNIVGRIVPLFIDEVEDEMLTMYVTFPVRSLRAPECRRFSQRNRTGRRTAIAGMRRIANGGIQIHRISVTNGRSPIKVEFPRGIGGGGCFQYAIFIQLDRHTRIGYTTGL